MTTLTELMQDPSGRRRVIEDGARLVDDEVRAKTGITGMAIKTAYRTVKALKPGIIEEAVESLLPEFAPALDPHYARARESGDPRAYFDRNAQGIAESLLEVTDARVARSEHQAIKRAYSGLRGQAKKHTAAAMPRVGELMHRHLG